MEPPLITAVRSGDVQRVRQLLAGGCDVNEVHRTWTPMTWACYYGYPDTVKALLDAGADIDWVDKFGVTALMFASNRGHPAVVKLLLAAGADIEKEDLTGWTALMWGAMYGHLQVVTLLVAAGACLEKVCYAGKSSLSMAANQGHREIAMMLLTSSLARLIPALPPAADRSSDR